MSKTRNRRKRGEIVPEIGVSESLDPQSQLGYRWTFYTEDQIMTLHNFGAPAAYGAVKIGLSDLPSSMLETARPYADERGHVWVNVDTY